jgi:hypothetical protein
VVVTGLAAGLYSDIKATLSGCSSAPFNEALTDPGTTSAPIITASLSSICPGEKTQLTATGCSGTVTWSNGSTGALVEVSPGVTTTYTSTCTFNGCTSLPSNPVVVTVKTLPLSTGYLITSPTTSCTNDGEILFAGLLPSTLYQIEYEHNGNPHSAMLTSDLDGNLKLTQCEKGDYTAITFNNEGCKSLPQNITIQDPLLPLPPVVVAAEDTVCPG